MEAVHKINITDEAKFDVGECVGLEAFDWRTFKSETEEYIAHLSRANLIPWWGCFQAEYVDEDSGKRLKLFFYKGQTFGLMQTWDLKGVCEADGWTQDAEDDGQIRAWINTKLKDIPDEDDWVIRARVCEVIQNTQKTLWVNVLEEVTDAFECKRDKEAAERLAFLQSVFFCFKGWRRTRKTVERD